jgi:hypothetical protein
MANTRPLSHAAVGSKHVSAVGERRAVDIPKDTSTSQSGWRARWLGWHAFTNRLLPIAQTSAAEAVIWSRCRRADYRRDSVFLRRRCRRTIYLTTIS